MTRTVAASIWSSHIWAISAALRYLYFSQADFLNSKVVSALTGDQFANDGPACSMSSLSSAGAPGLIFSTTQVAYIHALWPAPEGVLIVSDKRISTRSERHWYSRPNSPSPNPYGCVLPAADGAHCGLAAVALSGSTRGISGRAVGVLGFVKLVYRYSARPSIPAAMRSS